MCDCETYDGMSHKSRLLGILCRIIQDISKQIRNGSEELQRGRQAAASSEGLRNWDRSQEELKLKRPKEELKPDLPSMTVLLDGLNPEEVGCLMRTCEAAGSVESECKSTFRRFGPKVRLVSVFLCKVCKSCYYVAKHLALQMCEC